MSVGGFAYTGYQDKDNTKYEREQEKARGEGTPLSSPVQIRRGIQRRRFYDFVY